MIIGLLSLVALANGAQILVNNVAECSKGTAAASQDRLDITAVYAQLSGGSHDIGSPRTLKILSFGQVGRQDDGFSNITGFLATVLTTSSVLSFNVYSDSSALCSTISSTSTPGCPYGPGAFGIGVDVNLDSSYPLATINTQIRVLDTSSPSLELACIDVPVTPYYPSFTPYPLFLWFTVALVISYAGVVCAGRLWAARTLDLLHRQAEVASSLTAKLSSDGGFKSTWSPVFWSFVSGATLQSSGALRRFSTPCVRDVLWYVQKIALLAMISVRWPPFAYPILAKMAWSTLAYSITLTRNGPLGDPLDVHNATLPSAFASVTGNTTSSLYLDPSIPNVLLDLGQVKDGLASLAQLLGIHKTDFFGNAAVIFLSLVGLVILVSFATFAVATLVDRYSQTMTSLEPPDALRIHSRDIYERCSVKDGDTVNTEQPLFLHPSRSNAYLLNQTPQGRSFTKHICLGIGNFMRLLLLFHLPLVAFSIYQLSLGSQGASKASIALAALFFIIFGVLLPCVALWQIYLQNSAARRTNLHLLLALGPMYIIYNDSNFAFMGVKLLSNLITGITIGAAQGHGTAQVVVILIVEVAEAVFNFYRLPWADNSAMGGLAFLGGVAHVVTAVLLVILSPAVSLGRTACGWVTYAILVIQCLLLLLLTVMLIIKMIELVFRMCGHVPMDGSRSARAGGLFGALRRHRKARQRAMSARDDLASSPGVLSERRVDSEDPDYLQSDMSTSFYENYSSYDDDGYIMSALHPREGSSRGTSAVRGGNASVTSPYNTKAAASSSGHVESIPPTPSAELIPHQGRPRARSFTADIGYLPARPTPDLLTNFNPPTLETPAADSKPKKSRRQSRLLSKFTRQEATNEDTSEDSDEYSDEPDDAHHSTDAHGSKWSFFRPKKEQDEQQPVAEPSFSVVRKPKQVSPTTGR